VAEIVLRGMTWDHARGFDPMVATAADYAARHPGVRITWDKRSLQAFADRPIGTMADAYDLIVIDHPHVGEVARAGLLLDLGAVGRDAEMAALAAGSVGLSHPSYQSDGGQWALAIDAATPVACRRPDLLSRAPSVWEEVMDLARAGRVAIALVPINALMTFMGMARNRDIPLGATADALIDPAAGAAVLEDLLALARCVDPRCLALDPIGIYDWMGGQAEAPAYSPWGYGYTNYSRDGYCAFPLVFADAPGFRTAGPRGTVLGGTGIAVSARSRAAEIAVDYAFWIAGAECQKGLYTASGGQPGHAAAWEDEACNAMTRNFFRATRATLESAWLRPRHDGYMGFQDRAGDVVHACLRGEARVAETVARINALWSESWR
jgi:multiple sugar transport system substrate-binding protein